MKHDLKILKFISAHSSVAFKIAGIGVEVLFHLLAVGILNLGKPVSTSIKWKIPPPNVKMKWNNALQRASWVIGTF